MRHLPREQRSRLGIVTVPDADEHEQARPDLPYNPALDRHRRLIDPLDQRPHALSSLQRTRSQPGCMTIAYLTC
jgi:hypothetical protein